MIRVRSYEIEFATEEATLSGAIPDVVGPIGVISRVAPSALATRFLDRKRRRKKRPLQRRPSRFSLPLQSRQLS